MEPHDLYGLPLEQFTGQRNALAGELRREGRRDEAAAVAKLRKPSVAAWAVNQLVRTQRRDVDALLQAGDALQQAQADLLARRGDAATLRKAVEDERLAAERLVAKARGLLDADGHELTTPRLEQVTETLHAAALDHDARARVQAGCLERELRHVGLGSLGRPSTGTAKTLGPRTDRAPARTRREPKRDARQRSTTRQEQSAVRRERAAKEKAAREAEATARRRLERTTRRQQTAARRRERAAAELRDAEAELAAAREATAEAETELERANRLLGEL